MRTGGRTDGDQVDRFTVTNDGADRLGGIASDRTIPFVRSDFVEWRRGMIPAS